VEPFGLLLFQLLGSEHKLNTLPKKQSMCQADIRSKHRRQNATETIRFLRKSELTGMLAKMVDTFGVAAFPSTNRKNVVTPIT
jgi:hypothetical protein